MPVVESNSFSKDELVLFHQLLLQVREGAGVAGKASFQAYEAFGVTPLSFGRKRADHKRAVLLLAQGLAHALSDGEYGNAARLGRAFHAHANPPAAKEPV